VPILHRQYQSQTAEPGAETTAICAANHTSEGGASGAEGEAGFRLTLSGHLC